MKRIMLLIVLSFAFLQTKCIEEGSSNNQGCFDGWKKLYWNTADGSVVASVNLMKGGANLILCKLALIYQSAPVWLPFVTARGFKNNLSIASPRVAGVALAASSLSILATGHYLNKFYSPKPGGGDVFLSCYFGLTASALAGSSYPAIKSVLIQAVKNVKP